VPYIKAKGIKSAILERSYKAYNAYSVTIDAFDPSTGEEMTVRVHFFENKKKGNLPLLIIVPPINGVSYREKNVSDHFIRRGYHTVVIEPVKNVSDNSIPLRDFQKNLLCFVGAIRSAIDVFSEKEQIDPKNIFIWGASMGAIHSSIVVSVDMRVNAAILIVGGASITDIVTESTQRHVTRYRNTRMLAENISSTEEFRSRLKEHMYCEVPAFATKRNASDLFFVVALKDSSVPTKYQVKLANAFPGTPTIREYNSPHAKTLLRAHASPLEQYSNFINSKLKH
jgi:dienelactone hydrolase